MADFQGGWTCCVEQGHYGHRARKATWLYAVGVDLPILKWGPSIAIARLDDGFHSASEREQFRSNRSLSPELSAKKSAWMDNVEAATGKKFFRRLGSAETAATPVPFRDLLIGMTDAERRRAVKTGVVQNMSSNQRARTPHQFQENISELVRGSDSKSTENP